MLNPHSTTHRPVTAAPAAPGSRARLGAPTAGATLLLALGGWLVLDQLAAFLLAAGLAPGEIAFWRLLLAGCAFAAHALLSHHPPRLEPRTAWRVMALAVVGAALVGALGLPSGTSAELLVVALLVAALLVSWRVVLYRPRGLRSVNVLLVGVLAALLLAQWPRAALAGAALGPLLLVGGALAAYYLLGRSLLARSRPLALYALVLPLTAALLLPTLALAPKTAAVWLGLGLFALVSSYGLYSLYYLVSRQLGLTRARAAASAEAVATSLVALLIVGSLSPAAVLAAALLGALLITAVRAVPWRWLERAARAVVAQRSFHPSGARTAARALETQTIALHARDGLRTGQGTALQEPAPHQDAPTDSVARSILPASTQPDNVKPEARPVTPHEGSRAA